MNTNTQTIQEQSISSTWSNSLIEVSAICAADALAFCFLDAQSPRKDCSPTFTLIYIPKRNIGTLLANRLSLDIAANDQDQFSPHFHILELVFRFSDSVLAAD